jgi:hypothetical protein
LFAACGATPEPEADAGWQPETVCPGGPGCADSDGVLRAGAAATSIVPSCYEIWEPEDGDSEYNPGDDSFLDCGCDRLCPTDAGWTAPDAGEGDGVFQAIWMAGFGQARAAVGVRGEGVGLRGEGDGIDARVLVLEQGDTALAIVVLDLVGFMYDDVVRLREDVAAAGLPIDHVIVTSSHGHEGPDTMGIWGPNITTTGYDPVYAAQVRADALGALTTAVASLQPVSLEVGQVDATDYADNGVANLIRDTRDPVIVDPRVGTARFVADDGTTVATLVHWANHPETVADENLLVTSDFAHALRQTVESGSIWGDTEATPGIGGVALFLNGTVGGMMTSLGAAVVDPLGTTWADASFEKADVVGQLVGEMALDAVQAGAPTDVSLSFGAQSFFLPVDNFAYQAMFLLGVLEHREAYNYDPDAVLSDANRPEVRSEVDVVRLGALTLVTVPGEPLPEFFVGGYDGRYTPPGSDIVSADNPNPPNLALAPAGTTLEERFGSGTTWALGLGNDEIGYIVPEYDFVVADPGAYVLEADGDHYEETNSLGRDTAGLVGAEIERLADWVNPP